jgi:hypothetical protein
LILRKKINSWCFMTRSFIWLCKLASWYHYFTRIVRPW